MKKVYGRILEVSKNGEDWEFAAFFNHDYCYREEIPELQEVDIATTYEEAVELVKSWELEYKEKKSIFTRNKYLVVKIPFTEIYLHDNGKPKNFQIRVKYKEEKNISMYDLMKYMSHKDFQEWAKDNNLTYFEKNC